MHLLNHLRCLLTNNYDQLIDVTGEEDVDNGNRSVITSTEAEPVRLAATVDDASPSDSGCGSSDEERATPTKKKKKKKQSGTKTTNKAAKKKTVTSKDNTAKKKKKNSSNSSNHRRSSSGSSSNSSKGSFDEEVGLHDNNDSMGSTASNSCSSHGSGHEDGNENDDHHHHRCLEHDDLDCYIVHTSGQQPQSIDDDDDGYEEVDYDSQHMIPPDEPQQQSSSSQQQQEQRMTPRSSIQMFLYRRICQELAWDGKIASLFRCIDPITNLPLDIPRTFAPRGIRVLIWKIIAAGMACSTMMMGIRNVAKPTFYLAYLTHWSILFCTVYLVMSLSNSIVTTLFSSSKGKNVKHKQLPTSKQKDGRIIPNDVDDTTISPPLCWRYRFTWIMFELGAHTASGASLMFWTVLVFNLKKPLTYNIVSNHGIILLVTLIDGMIMNRIPYRLHHWYVFVLPIHLLYVVWTLVHDFLLHVGNPDLHDDDPNVNDDCIYQGVLEWKDSWYIALFTSTGLIFVIGPVFLLILWYLSIYPIMSICTCQKRMRFRDRLLYQNRRVRHYVDGDDDSDDDDMMYDDEENSGSTAELSFHSSSASSDDDDEDDQI